VRPLCLPSEDLNTDTDEFGKPLFATVAGWGLQSYNGKASPILRNPIHNTSFPS